MEESACRSSMAVLGRWRWRPVAPDEAVTHACWSLASAACLTRLRIRRFRSAVNATLGPAKRLARSACFVLEGGSRADPVANRDDCDTRNRLPFSSGRFRFWKHLSLVK